MKKIWNCRRSTLAVIGMACLTFLGYTKGLDVSMPLSAIVASVAASNSFEKKGSNNA